jgi:N-methylhydantoinase B
MAIGVYTSEGVPKTPGILGGLPGSTGETLLLTGSDVRERFAGGILPGSLDELDGERAQTYGKGAPLIVDDASVVEWNWGGSAGYGDPITRDPARVAADVAAGVVRAHDAESEYGVILVDGAVDEAATSAARTEIRRRRLAAAAASGEPRALSAAASDGALVIGDDIVADEREGRFTCAHCGDELGRFETHALACALVLEQPVAALGQSFTDPSIFIDDEIVWRQLLCPGCATRLGGQAARPGDEILADFRLNP